MQNCFDPAIISLSIVWKPLQNDSYFLVCGLDGVKSLPQLTTSVISWNEELVRKFGFTCPGVRFSWQAAAAGVFMALFFGPNPERYIRVYNEFLLLFWNISWRLVAGCWSNVFSSALPWSLSRGRERRAQTLTGREQCSRLLERLKPSVTCSLWHSHELNSGDATNGPRVYCLCSFRHRFNWLLFKPPPQALQSFCYSRPLYEQWGYHGDSLVTHKTVSTTAHTRCLVPSLMWSVGAEVQPTYILKMSVEFSTTASPPVWNEVWRLLRTVYSVWSKISSEPINWAGKLLQRCRSWFSVPFFRKSVFGTTAIAICWPWDGFKVPHWLFFELVLAFLWTGSDKR